MRSRRWSSSTRLLVELARDQRDLLARDAIDDDLAMSIANDVLGDPPKRAFVGPVLMADPHHDQVGVLFARDFDDSVAGLSGDVDLGARRDGMLRRDEGGGVERALDAWVLLRHRERRLEWDFMDVDDQHLGLVALVQPGGELHRADRGAQVEDRNQHPADRFHRPHTARRASGSRRRHPQHPAEGAGQPDGERDRQRDSERAEDQVQWRRRSAACRRQAPKASRPTPAMPYGTECTSITSRARTSTPSTRAANPTIRVKRYAFTPSRKSA